MRPMSRFLGVLILVASLPAAATSSVLVVVETDLAREVAGELSDPFSKQKVKMKVAGGQSPASQCLTKPASERGRCFSQAGQTAFVDAVLLLAASSSKGRTTVTFQLLSLDEGRLIKREVATGPAANLGKALKPVVARLAKLIKPGPARPSEKAEPAAKPEPEPVAVVKPEPEPVRPQPPVVKPDVPKKAVLEPVVVAPPPAAVVAPVEPKGSGLRVAAWTTTGLAVAAAGVAGTFGALGLTTQGQLDQHEGGVSALTRSQANALAAQANTNYTIALGAGIGAGVLGVVSAILWSQTP